MGTIITLIIVIIVGALGAAFMALRARRDLDRLSGAAEECWVKVWDTLQTNTVLMPMLLHKVREYTNFEKEIFRDVDYAMQLTAEVHGPLDLPRAENATRDALRRLAMIDDYYPPLGKDSDYLDLRARAKDNEMGVQFARESYNLHAHQFNERLTETYWGRYWAKRRGLREFVLVDLYNNAVPHADGRPTTTLAPTSA